MEKTNVNGGDGATCADEDASSCQAFVEIAEKASIVLAMHLNDACKEQLIDRERAKMVSIALASVISFLNSADQKQKITVVNEMLSKDIVEGIGAYFSFHWTGGCYFKPIL